MNKVLRVIILLFLASSVSRATTYYVAKNGSDSNPGTQESPFLSIQHAANSVSAGDTVIVAKAGLVYVLGEVGQPGAYTVDETHPTTVLKLIALAKGPTGNASLKRASVLHQSASGLSESSVPLNDILRARAGDVPLQAEDILMVPGKHHFILSSGNVVQTLTTLAIYRGF